MSPFGISRPGRRPALALIVPLFLVLPAAAVAQARRAETGALPTIEEKTAGMQRIEGFFPLYWDAGMGTLYMELARFNTEVLHIRGLAAGLGSNDIGLDRGSLLGSRVVSFERVGRKILMVQPNYDYRASSANPNEVRAVRDAFARSVLWGFPVAAETDGRALVELTDFVINDADNIGDRMQPGQYRLDASRSAVSMPMTMGFPENTEIEVELTFTRRAGGGPGAGGSFEGVGSVAATPDAATLRVHDSFVALPDDEYVPRPYDPRAGYGGAGHADYAVALGEPLLKRFIRRHRLRKVDPSAAVSEAVEPIVYYLDPGAPEPIRSALLDGARWWNQAFEAAGYRDAFRVEILPEGVSPLDVRYNVINWVHRSTRGWSYGASVTDPRTGEIIKGVVTLGSLRVRQDYLIAEGLLAPYVNGTETPPELAAWALARIRQLSAHEVGHTLGLAHNYYNSRAGRISVLDYPHPLVTLARDGTFDFSQVYAEGIGEWDKVSILYGYQDFPAGVDEAAALAKLLADAWAEDLRFLTNQDIEITPAADQWANGTDVAAELDRMMEVRRAALQRFGENAIKRGMPLATMEEALVPLYMHHRYQVSSTASAIGGLRYVYAMRGDGRTPVQRVSGAEQRDALRALLATLIPSSLALPETVLRGLPPRPMGYFRHRELFPRYTGGGFDVVTPAVVAAGHTIAELLDDARVARVVEQHAVDPSLPGLEEVIDRLFEAAFDARAPSPYEAELRRAVQSVVIEHLSRLAATAPMPQVRAVASMRLERRLATLQREAERADEADAAHFRQIAGDITRFLERPGAALDALRIPTAPPGAPIGDPAMDWLGTLEPACSHRWW
ncbi:MAG TPA: zinc-dependent metalloprotease [Gemmatimonadales bacterium]